MICPINNIPSLDAPVRCRELVDVLGVSKQAISKQARREGWEPLVSGSQIWPVDKLPDRVRGPVLEARKRSAKLIVEQLVAPVPSDMAFPHPPEFFTEDEQTEGCERRDFLIEVERMRIEEDYTYPACCEKIELREKLAAHRHDGSLRYRKLFVSGYRYQSQLTFDNFRRWKALWNDWRCGVLDTRNWQSLCPRNRFRQVKDCRNRLVRLEPLTSERAGDATFWALFDQLYCSTVKRTRIHAYELARDKALLAGVAAEKIPQLYQVAYYYTRKQDRQMLERAREGEKHFYDDIRVIIARSWVKTHPHLCYSGDHHMLNLFIRVPDETTGGWRKERPWLTDWIDVSSWYTVGWHISICPSRDTIEIALRNGLRLVKGAPKHLYFDNGKDYRAFSDGGRLGYDRVRTAGICAALGIHPIYALPHNPGAKLNERNYRVMERFEWLWPSYSGRNKKHMDALWDSRREDGYTLRERLETYSGRHPLQGCLVRPELLPTLDEVRVAFAKWLAERRHLMVSKGRVCPGQSPAQRFGMVIEPSLLRPVSEAEMSLAFLRVHPTLRPVRANGTFVWTPPGGASDMALVFADSALRPFSRSKIQVRYDLNFYPPRVFAFAPVEHEDRGETVATWKVIPCAGPEGSVVSLDMPDAIVEGDDASQKLRDTLARTRSQGKETKRLRAVEAERLAEEQLARERGLTPGARVYEIKPRDVRGRAALNKSASDRLDKAVNGLGDLIADEDREAYRKGIKV